MPRPSDTPFDWASDGVHSDPGEVWDGQPSVAVPSAGQIAAGFRPGEKVPAEWLNEIVRREGAWSAYLQELTAEETILIPPAAFAIWGGAQLVDGFGGYSIDGPILNFPAGVDCWAEVDLAAYLPRDASVNRIRWTGSLDDTGDAITLSRWRRTRGSSLPPTTQAETVIGIRTGALGGFDLTSSTVWTPLTGGVNTLRLRTPAANVAVSVIFDVEVRFTRV